MSGPAVKKEVQISKGAVVCVESKLQGIISIGAKTLVHPKASVIAEAGPIVIGQSNILEEQSIIHHRSDVGEDRPKTMVIGSNNVFEVGAVVNARSIGDNNVFESKCYIGPDIEVGNGCVIGAGVSLVVKEKLRDNLVISGSNYYRAIAPEKPPGISKVVQLLSVYGLCNIRLSEDTSCCPLGWELGNAAGACPRSLFRSSNHEKGPVTSVLNNPKLFS